MATAKKTDEELETEMERIQSEQRGKQGRSSRSQSSRSNNPVHDQYADQWKQKGVLNTEDIPPRPGYVQRWIRTLSSGENDQSNVIRQSNSGWKPRKSDTIGEGSVAPTRQFQGANVVGVDGMILCERPAEQHRSQSEYIKRLSDRQMQASDESAFKDTQGISVSRKSKSTIRKPQVMDDY